MLERESETETTHKIATSKKSEVVLPCIQGVSENRQGEGLNNMTSRCRNKNVTSKMCGLQYFEVGS